MIPVNEVVEIVDDVNHFGEEESLRLLEVFAACLHFLLEVVSGCLVFVAEYLVIFLAFTKFSLSFF